MKTSDVAMKSSYEDFDTPYGICVTSDAHDCGYPFIPTYLTGEFAAAQLGFILATKPDDFIFLREGNERTGGNILDVSTTQQSPEVEKEVKYFSNSEMLSLIRANLSLNISELSLVMQVERPTIYAWINGSAKPRAQHLERLQVIFELARFWMQNTQEQLGAYLHYKRQDELSILDLLKDRKIDKGEIFGALKDVLNKLSQPTEGEQSTEGVRETLRRLGIQHKEGADRQDVIDFLTGKRPGPE